MQSIKKIDIRSLIIGILLAALIFVVAGAAPSKTAVTGYAINSFEDADNLEKWVNSRIKEGWQPLGGISISHVQYSNGKWGLHQSQAMVK